MAGAVVAALFSFAPKSADAVTGIGATLAAWDAHHVPATRCFEPNPCHADSYDARPGWPAWTCTHVVYCALDVLDSDPALVQGYTMQFSARSTLGDAKEVAAGQLPPDAHVEWYWVPRPGLFNACTEEGLSSRSLGRSLLHWGLGGGVLVVFWWGYEGNRDYVKGATLSLAGNHPIKMISCGAGPH